MKYCKPLLLLALLAAGSLITGCGPRSASNTTKLLEVPAAAGSLAPNLVAGPDGTVVLSWMEPAGESTTLKYSVLADGLWTAPVTVASGDDWFVNWADFPSVVPLGRDLWGAHWLRSQPDGGYAYDVVAAMSFDDGKTWQEPFTPHFDGTPTEHGFVTLFPDSAGMGLVWLDGRKYVNDYDEDDVTASGMTLRAAVFGRDGLPVNATLVDDLTCDCCQTDVAITAEGPVAIYRNRTQGEIRDIYVSRRLFGEWQPGQAVNDDSWEIAACPVNGPVIRADGKTVSVAWFTAAGDHPTVKAAWSNDAGATFTDPVEVATDKPLGHVGATLLPGGDLAVLWQRAAGEGRAQLVLRRVSQRGNHSDAVVLAVANDVFAFSVPQIVAAAGGLVVAWTVEIDDEMGVRSAWLPYTLLGR